MRAYFVKLDIQSTNFHFTKCYTGTIHLVTLFSMTPVKI